MSGVIVEDIDAKGRHVRLSKTEDGTVVETYYIGRDCEGVIHLDGDREYVIVDGARRYWGGIIDPLPNDPRIRQLNEFTVFVIKPDGMALELGKAVSRLIQQVGGTVVATRDFTYTDTTIRKMYPHFFALEWEKSLFDYLQSGPSRCLLVRGTHPHRRLLTLRNSIRTLFGYNNGPRVRSLVHCAQTQSTAIKQALLFFSLDEIVESVGIRSRRRNVR